MPDDEGTASGADSGRLSKFSQHWKEFAEATPEEHKK